jgi:hypothetical protein
MTTQEAQTNMVLSCCIASTPLDCGAKYVGVVAIVLDAITRATLRLSPRVVVVHLEVLRLETDHCNGASLELREAC